jgi:hypothetical protein
MLRSKLRVPLALFDQDALDEIELTTDLQEDMSFTLPFDFESQNPNGRDLISMMANSVNAQVYTKLDGTFTLKKIIPPETIGAIEVTKDDIISSSFNYDLIYQNLLASISFTHNEEDFSYVSEDRLTFGSSSLTYRESFVDEAIRYGSESTTEKESLCYYLADVIANSTKQKAIYAYPLGMFSLTLPLSFSNIEIGQTFKIDRSILPTFAGLSDEKFIYADVTNISIGQNSVSFQLWDKQGIIKNEGDF